MTNEVTSGTLASDGSTPVLKGNGTHVQCLFKGDFGGGIVDLEVSQDNGITYYATGDRFSAAASFLINPFKAKYKFTLSGSTSPSINYVINGQ